MKAVPRKTPIFKGNQKKQLELLTERQKEGRPAGPSEREVNDSAAEKDVGQELERGH